MRPKVRLAWLAIGALIAVLGTSIAAAAPPPPVTYAPLLPTKPGSGQGLKIGYISLNESIGYIHTVTLGIEKNAKIAGATVIVCDSKGDAGLALACAKTFKTEGVQGILNFQVNEEASAKICAAGPNVPVIAIDIFQKPCQISFLGVSNYGTGFVIGQAGGKAFKQKSDCKYDAMFILGNPSSGTIFLQRKAGMLNGFASVCGPAHNIRLLYSPGGDETSATAESMTTSALTAVPSPEKVLMLSLNGDMTLGALAAVTRAGRDAEFHLIGFGLDTGTMCKVMSDPSWLGDGLLFPEHYGPVAVQNIIKAIKGQPIPKTLYIKSAFASDQTIPIYYPALKKCVPK